MDFNDQASSQESDDTMTISPTMSTASSTSPGFGFSFTSVDDFKDNLDAIGSEITTMQQFWNYSMDVFIKMIDTVANELINAITTDEEKRQITTT